MNDKMGQSGQENESQVQLLEIYKLHVESAAGISNRRLTLTRYYVIVVFGLVTGFFKLLESLHTQKIPEQIANYLTPEVITITAGLIGILLSWTWFVRIDRYLQVNSRKFNVLRELERKLDYQFYDKTLKFLRESDREHSYWIRGAYHLSMPCFSFLLFLFILLMGVLGLHGMVILIIMFIPLLLITSTVVHLFQQRRVEKVNF